jgi:hypothetical protein
MALLQAVRLRVPLLIAAAGEKTAECDRVISSLCSGTLKLDVKCGAALGDLCAAHGLPIPVHAQLHPIRCPAVPDLVSAARLLRAEPYHFFARTAMNLVFVDCALTPDIAAAREAFLRLSGFAAEDALFAVVHATEALTDLPPETVCLCFRRETSLSFVREFLACSAAPFLARAIAAELRAATDSPAAARSWKMRADLSAIGGRVRDAVHAVARAISELEPQGLPDWTGVCFETLGMLEDRERGIAKAQKNNPTGTPPQSFSNVDVTPETPISTLCYLFAAGHYQKANCFDRVVDAGIRILVAGDRSLIYAIAAYVVANRDKERIQQKAWDLFRLVQRLGMPRKAALLACEFAGAFKTDRAAFRIQALNLILKESSAASLVQLRDLSIPMLEKLLKRPQVVPNSVLARFLSTILSTIGPSIPLRQQEKLFSQLAVITANEIELPITIRRLEVKRLQYDIIKHETGAKKGVFLYSYIQDRIAASRLTVPRSQTVSVTLELYNPFRLIVKLENLHVVTDSTSTLCKASTEFLNAQSVTTVHLYVVPTQMASFSVLGIEFSIFSAKQILRCITPIEVIVVDNVPRYHLRTDLPISSELALYDGEIHEFRFWITNSGDVPITNVQIRFQQPEITHLITEPRLPLLPGCQLSIKCCLTADKSENTIGLTLISSCADSDYSCSQLIRQYLAISDSLSVRRIFPLKIAPPQEGDDFSDAWVVNQTDQIYVGYEVENESDCTFQYNATVSQTRMSGLIGRHESILMVASYATAELRSDGSDAQKSRTIAMTKTMEESLHRELSSEERVKVAKCVSIMQRLEAMWNFDWAVSSTRRGKLVRRNVTLDDDLYQGIESRQIRARIAWVQNGIVSKVVPNVICEMVADFEHDQIVQCVLEFVGEDDRNRTILWEGELDQGGEAAIFKFVLCFTEVGKFKMIVRHVAKSGITGITPVLVTVQL